MALYQGDADVIGYYLWVLRKVPSCGACPVLDTLEAVLRWQGSEQDWLYHNSESSTQAAPTLATHHSLTRSYRDLMPRLT